MSDFFRIVRGLQIDEAAQILQGAGAPGASADTNNAPVGSLYLDTSNGSAWTKVAPGAGANKWLSVGQTLYSEFPNLAPSLPSALGNNTIALGFGAQTAPGSDGSLAIGNQSYARLPGSQMFANGRFGSAGDAQAGKYMLRTHTVNSSFTEAFLDGTAGTQRLVLPDDSTWTFTATITGHRTDAGDGHAGYRVEGVIYRGAGVSTVAFQGLPVKTVLAESDAAWDINISADGTYGSLKIEVRGQAGKTIRWAALVETVEVTN